MLSWRRFLVVGAMETLCLVPGLLAQATIPEQLAAIAPDQTTDVIVRYKPGVDDLRRSRIVGRAIRHNHDLWLLRSHAVTIKRSDLAALAADPDVEAVLPDHDVAITTSNIVPDYGWLTVLGLNSRTATFPYDGTGIGVAVIDSGITLVNDLNVQVNNRFVYSQSFVPNDKSTDDAYGHGTHVAGIIAGNGKNSSGDKYTYEVRGIAPNVNLINLRVLDGTGTGKDSSVIAAIQTAIALQKQYNIRVINLSLGRAVFESYTMDPLCQAVEAAWKAGIVVVVAAGNEGRNNAAGTHGYGTISAPGNDPYVITVGAMKTENTLPRSDDLVASYSSKGPTMVDHIVKPDLVAPGNRIVSVLGDGTLPNLYKANVVASAYFMLSGTSMAAPMVSGAAALLLQFQPGLTPDQV